MKKAPRWGPLVCVRCREHCASCVGHRLISRNIRQAPIPPKQPQGVLTRLCFANRSRYAEGRTYANLLFASEHLKSLGTLSHWPDSFDQISPVGKQSNPLTFQIAYAPNSSAACCASSSVSNTTGTPFPQTSVELQNAHCAASCCSRHPSKISIRASATMAWSYS